MFAFFLCLCKYSAADSHQHVNLCFVVHPAETRQVTVCCFPAGAAKLDLPPQDIDQLMAELEEFYHSVASETMPQQQEVPLPGSDASLTVADWTAALGQDACINSAAAYSEPSEGSPKSSDYLPHRLHPQPFAANQLYEANRPHGNFTAAAMRSSSSVNGLQYLMGPQHAAERTQPFSSSSNAAAGHQTNLRAMGITTPTSSGSGALRHLRSDLSCMTQVNVDWDGPYDSSPSQIRSLSQSLVYFPPSATAAPPALPDGMVSKFVAVELLQPVPAAMMTGAPAGWKKRSKKAAEASYSAARMHSRKKKSSKGFKSPSSTADLTLKSLNRKQKPSEEMHESEGTGFFGASNDAETDSALAEFGGTPAEFALAGPAATAAAAHTNGTVFAAPQPGSALQPNAAAAALNALPIDIGESNLSQDPLPESTAAVTGRRRPVKRQRTAFTPTNEQSGSSAARMTSHEDGGTASGLRHGATSVPQIVAPSVTPPAAGARQLGSASAPLMTSHEVDGFASGSGHAAQSAPPTVVPMTAPCATLHAGMGSASNEDVSGASTSAPHMMQEAPLLTHTSGMATGAESFSQVAAALDNPDAPGSSSGTQTSLLPKPTSTPGWGLGPDPAPQAPTPTKAPKAASSRLRPCAAASATPHVNPSRGSAQIRMGTTRQTHAQRHEARQASALACVKSAMKKSHGQRGTHKAQQTRVRVPGEVLTYHQGQRMWGQCKGFPWFPAKVRRLPTYTFMHLTNKGTDTLFPVVLGMRQHLDDYQGSSSTLQH